MTCSVNESTYQIGSNESLIFCDNVSLSFMRNFGRHTQPLTELLMFCKECANCRNKSKCGQKTLLVLRTSDGTNLVKLVKCPKGGGRCSTENQFQAWVSSGLFGNSPIWGPALNCVSGRDC